MRMANFAEFIPADLLDKGYDIADFMSKINMFTVGKAVIGFVPKGTYACDSMWIISKGAFYFAF